MNRARVLSILLTPVAGYLALGRWRRALAFAAATALVLALALAALLGSVPWATWALLALGLCLYVAAVADVGRLARRGPAGRWRWGPAIAGGMATILVSGALQPLRAQVVGSFRGATGTMLPTLAAGDRFFVDKRRRELRRGDVVMFRFPPAPAPEYVTRVKRVVALAGDTIEMRDGVVWLNGAAVASRQLGTVRLPAAGVYFHPPDDLYQEWEEILEARRYRVLRVPGGRRSSFAPVTVPAGHFFMLGDNRDNNRDSRVYDLLQVDSVIGRALWIWWPVAAGRRL
jgi:signal peptidase I